MEYKPHPYQQAAIDRMLSTPKVGLFLGVGLGKTSIALTAVAELMRRGEAHKVLVVAPLRVAETTWTAEATKWEHTRHLRMSKVLGPAVKRRQALAAETDVFVINRENVQWLVEYYRKRWPFDMLVVDELSSFKAYDSKRFKALKSVLPMVKRVAALTATPCSNGLIDLWPQIYLLDEGARLGRYITAYREKFFTATGGSGYCRWGWTLNKGAEEAIHAAIGDLCMSMSAEDYLTLPPRIDRVVSVELPPMARRQYKVLEKELILALEQSDIVAGSAAILSGKLRQVANGACYDENGVAQPLHTAKLDALADLVESANGNPMLVFYEFRHDAIRIYQHLQAHGLPLPSSVKSEADIEKWNRGETPILLAHPASAAHGLNLQAGGHVIVWFGLPWSLELYQQSCGRLHRGRRSR